MKSLILWNADLILRKKILILLNAILITWNENLITFETKSALEYKSTLNFICISILKRPFHECNKLGKICRQHGKERLKISKIVSSAKSRNFTDVCIVGRGGGRGHICAPHHTNVCKISRLCGGAISSIVFNKSLSNLAILLILIEKTVKGSVDCNFRIATGQKIGLGYREQPRQNTQTEPDQENETSWKFIKN